MKHLFGYILCMIMLCSVSGFAHSQNYKIETSSGGKTLDFGQFIVKGDTAKGWIKITNTGNNKAKYRVQSTDRFPGEADFMKVNGVVITSITFELLPNEVKVLNLYYAASDIAWGRFVQEIEINIDNSIIYNLYVIHRVSPTVDLQITNGKSILFNGILFNDIEANSSECTPFYIINATPYPAIIRRLEKSNDYTNTLSNSENYSYPIVLLPGEKINLLTICYNPSQPNQFLENYSYNLFISINNNETDYSIPLRGYSSTDPLLLKPCVTLSIDSNLFGPVLMNASVKRRLTVQSNRYLPITITKSSFDWGDTTSFSVVGNPFPLAIPAKGQNSFEIQFTPSTIKPFVKYRYATGFSFVATTDSETCSGLFTFAGVALVPTNPATATPLFPQDSEQLQLAMSAPGQTFSQTFYFYNNQTKTIKVTSVFLKDNVSGFSIGNISPTNILPFSLASGDTMSIVVNLSTSSFDVIYNELEIVTELGIQALRFHLQGLRMNGTTSVSETSPQASGTISVFPNPSMSEIAIHLSNLKSSTIEIFDVLGNNLFRQDGNECRWTATHSGTYYVRVSGYTEYGEPFIKTKKILIAK